MKNFFDILGDGKIGFDDIFLTVAGLMILVHYILFMFRLGRYKPVEGDSEGDGSRGFLRIFVLKTVTNFRNLLALVVAVIFTGALFYAMVFASKDDETFKQQMEAIQVVVASLGGLIGSIIGYYFGESKAAASVIAADSADGNTQDDPTNGNDPNRGIVNAPNPPELGNPGVNNPPPNEEEPMGEVDFPGEEVEGPEDASDLHPDDR